jgi:hypothetical protein|tara:strand:- start:23626 stop:24171 length:546 start_codon:yes stop_codon:yes gene_type:complete
MLKKRNKKMSNKTQSFQAKHWSNYSFQRGLIDQLENQPSFFVFHGPGSQGNLPKEELKENKREQQISHENKKIFQLVSNKSFINLLFKIKESFSFLGIFHGPTLLSPLSFSKPKTTKLYAKHKPQGLTQSFCTGFEDKRICLGWVDLPFFFHNLEVSALVDLSPLVEQQISCLNKKFTFGA